MQNRPTVEALRIRAGISKTNLAQEAELSPSTYVRIIKGDQRIRPENLQRCLNVLNRKLMSNYDLEDIDYYHPDTK